VVAPYNVQVSLISACLPPGARVGTVDKFQGQEAPVVIYSMATSSAQEAPRGMEFLYSPNRLNVATSRARCLVVVVASPEVFTPSCTTSQQMKLANAFCRYRELAIGRSVAFVSAERSDGGPSGGLAKLSGDTGSFGSK
jgi:superfamily I DNA and/or RNA helicase